MFRKENLIYTCIREFSIEDLNQLNDFELELWEKDKKYRRQGEDWLAGRVAAKFVISQVLEILNLKEILIKNKENGMPYIDVGDVFFSISHSKGIGFACSSMYFSNIGCDIEVIKERPSNFIYYYSTDAELDTWSKLYSGEDRKTLETIIWSCKEAALKSLVEYKENFESFKNISVYPLNIGTFNFYFNFKKIYGVGHWDKYKNFIISVAVLF